MDEAKTVGAIVTGAGLAGTGSITVATITAPASGLLGVIGLTTTTTVALPIAGVVGVAGLIGYGIYKGVKWAKSEE
ncbi:MAG: hypothetical protein IGQ45_06935 [Cyanobacterium sp. T60_A2020_053]|nr:hypothetical protein [Cyanobacterium sp. T60_A2020_053]